MTPLLLFLVFIPSAMMGLKQLKLTFVILSFFALCVIKYCLRLQLKLYISYICLKSQGKERSNSTLFHDFCFCTQNEQFFLEVSYRNIFLGKKQSISRKIRYKNQGSWIKQFNFTFCCKNDQSSEVVKACSL